MNVILIKLTSGPELLATCDKGDADNYALSDIWVIVQVPNPRMGTFEVGIQPWVKYFGDVRGKVFQLPRRDVFTSTMIIDDALRGLYAKATDHVNIIAARAMPGTRQAG